MQPLCLDLGEISDGAQEMLIDSVMMIHVELHERDDTAEFRDEAPENAGFIHEAQNDFRLVARSQNAEKQPVGFRVGAQFRIDELEGPGHVPRRVRMDRETIAVGDPEKPDEIDRIAGENLRPGRP